MCTPIRDKAWIQCEQMGRFRAINLLSSRAAPRPFNLVAALNVHLDFIYHSAMAMFRSVDINTHCCNRYQLSLFFSGTI